MDVVFDAKTNQYVSFQLPTNVTYYCGIRKAKHLPLKCFCSGTVFSFVLLIACIAWATRKIKATILRRKRDKFFQQNGGHLLKQLLSSSNVEFAKIFTIKELRSATNNFCEDRIVGKGGSGTVYRGILPGNQVIAVKKSRVIDESQIEQFINELVILTRINHPNVVKLLGCCLEDEVPLLVYEFIPNGTLYDHIHAPAGKSWLSWSGCLRVATEAAKAVAYLHSIPIIHRDIKSTNILLDDSNMVKICDFGISRLIPVGRTRFSTLVHGTLGYLDPEYFLSSHLTSKSDVYSFGVILAELFTRQAPILVDKTHEEETNLSTYFLKSKESKPLNEIMDLKVVKEASQDQLIILGELIQNCFCLKGKDRPTMTEVTMVLEKLSKQLQKSQGN